MRRTGTRRDLVKVAGLLRGEDGSIWISLEVKKDDDVRWLLNLGSNQKKVAPGETVETP